MTKIPKELKQDDEINIKEFLNINYKEKDETIDNINKLKNNDNKEKTISNPNIEIKTNNNNNQEKYNEEKISYACFIKSINITEKYIQEKDDWNIEDFNFLKSITFYKNELRKRIVKKWFNDTVYKI